ncbi:hypothetical protein [Hyphomonas sp.]|uniref:hypothetical protein n=1 Tax=Hyphomonas sp. TaxID=87 RepID=UPI0030FC087C
MNNAGKNRLEMAEPHGFGLSQQSSQNEMAELIRLLNRSPWTESDARWIMLGIDPDSDDLSEMGIFQYLPGDSHLRNNESPDNRLKHMRFAISKLSEWLKGEARRPSTWIQIATDAGYQIPWKSQLLDDRSALKELPIDVREILTGTATTKISKSNLQSKAGKERSKRQYSNELRRRVAERAMLESNLPKRDFVDSILSEFYDDKTGRGSHSTFKVSPEKEFKMKSMDMVVKIAEQAWKAAQTQNV